MFLSNKSPIIQKLYERHWGIIGKTKSRIGIFVGGGCMSGIFSAGFLSFLEKEGFSTGFDVAIGTSAGAFNLRLFLNKQAKLLPSFYYKDCVNRPLINPLRFWQPVDINFIEQVLREKYRPPIVPDVNTQFLVSLTSTTGQNKLIDIRTTSDSPAIIGASMTIPIGIQRPVNLDGLDFIDGELSLPLPTEEIVNKLGLTDLLVIINRPFGPLKNNFSVSQKFLVSVFLQLYPDLNKIFNEWENIYNDGIAFLASQTDNNKISIVCPAPQNQASEICMNPAILKRVSDEAIKLGMTIFNRGG